MGAFAKWGAVKGAAEGAKEVFEGRIASRAAEEKSAADDARETRLEEIRQANRVVLEEQRGKQAQELETTRQEGEMESQEFLETGRMGRQTQEEEFEAGESALERASKEKIAGIKAKGKPGTKDKTFQSKMVKTGEMVNGIPVERDTPMVFDPHSGRGYVSENGQARIYGESRVADTPPKTGELRYLYKNPTPANLDKFARRYFYVPEDLLRYYISDTDTSE